jgi:thiamine biosynthesis protein ThiS
VKIRLNGRDQDAPEGATIQDLLDDAGLRSARVAVELNGRVVQRAGFERAQLRPGDVIEVVHFVGGG